MEDCDIKHRLSQAQVDSYIPSQIYNKSIETLAHGFEQTLEAMLFSEFSGNMQLVLANKKAQFRKQGE